MLPILVLFVTCNVIPVLIMMFVLLALEIEFLPQLVFVLMEPGIIILLIVQFVLKIVIPVKVLLNIV